MSEQPNRPDKNFLASWALPILLLIFIWPLGVFAIVLKLLSGAKRPDRRGQSYYARQAVQTPVGARTTAPRAEQPQQAVDPERLAPLAAKAKGLTILGGIVAALFGLVTLNTAVDYLWVLPGDVSWFLEEIIAPLSVTAAGLGCLWAGLRRKKRVRRYRSYLAMIGRRQSVSVSALSAAADRPADQVREELEDMLSLGLFETGFLDYGGDMLVLSADGLAERPREEEKKPSAQPAQGREDGILAEIREVNDAIANEKLSAQIDRVGVITAKILDYQRSHPEKAPQLHSFLSYYLPTTLKILRAYGQLESQEVAGENISAAMARIEGMMDKVVEGFEKQLDLLFQGDAMDLTADVEVLERMLAKDGLSEGQGLTLGR